MPSLDSPFGFFLMVDLLLFPVGVLVLVLILGKVRRVERATWAVVTQLQHLRTEAQPEDAVQRAVRQRESPGSGKISLSMFGR